MIREFGSPVQPDLESANADASEGEPLCTAYDTVIKKYIKIKRLRSFPGLDARGACQILPTGG